MTREPSHRTVIEQRSVEVERALTDFLSNTQGVAIVQAPPGSGKTHLLIQVVRAAVKRRLRVAIAAQTNSQADDICRRLAEDPVRIRSFRFVRRGNAASISIPGAVAVDSPSDIPSGSCVVVANTAKWGMSKVPPFDVLLVDEAWQMSWATFLPLERVAPRFVLIGDPGQIPPVVSVDTSRWETAPMAPHRAAPELLLEDRELDALSLELPASRRLPHDTTLMVQGFYRFPFSSWAAPGDRSVRPEGRSRPGVDRVIDLLREGSMAIGTLPTAEEGPPELDDELASVACGLTARILDRKTRITLGDSSDPRPREIAPEDIGLAATHRALNAALEAALPAALRGRVRVDTPERWQGLERKLMIVVHPLSSVARPSSFDLETGRLCVMASRHKAGLVIVSRDHVGDTLDGLLLAADQPIGRPDISGRGHAQHLRLWSKLAREGRIQPLDS